MDYPTIVYIEAALMENKELLHNGKSLGYISDKQQELVESDGAAKLSKGNIPIVNIGKNINPA